MNNRPGVLVGKSVVVRTPRTEPDYFTQTHRDYVGVTGVVHAIVARNDRENPLIKVKFPPDNRVVFFRLSELELTAQTGQP